MNQRGFRATPPHTFKQVQRARRVDIEIIERPLSGKVVTRLGRSMNHGLRTNFAEEIQHFLPLRISSSWCVKRLH